MLYREYLSVEADFIPVYSAGIDNINPDSWKSFYPHESFRKLLTFTLDSLDKGSAMKDRSIWLSGIYGTGKTYASFVVKHILEDNLSEVEKYLRHYELDGLYERLVGIRDKGKILVVHQSSSSGIDNQNKFFNTLIEAVKRELRAQGYKYFGAGGLVERVISTLKDPNSSFNFQAAFRKYRDRFLEYESANDVVLDLETLTDTERLDLLETVVAVAEHESYNWSQSVQDVMERLRDLRVNNNLHAVVFIWDEFTEYFRLNLNNITGLQEIAQNSPALSFYFLLITHPSDGQLIQDDVQRKIIEARFKMLQLSLAPKCAFELLSRVLRVKVDLSQEWGKISGQLWEAVERVVREQLSPRDNSLTPEHFVRLLPIHPYAAMLLKFMAQAISSNQRTMFNFLCSEQVGSFKNFIESHGFEYGGDNFLTADSLWDYFFQTNNPDLDDSFLEHMSSFDNFSVHCRSENQRRILKTVLLFCALQKKSYLVRDAGATSLLRATLKNISACFIGTSIENEVRSTLMYFSERGFFSELEEADDTFYLLNAGQFKVERLNNIQEQLRHSETFVSIVKEQAAFNKFIPTDFLKYRLVIKIGTPTSILKEGSIKYSLPDNQILLFLIFAGEELEQGKVGKAQDKIRAANPLRCIIADFSATPFTKQRREKFILNKARERYFNELPNQSGQARLAGRQASVLVEEWRNQLNITQVRISLGANESTQVVGGEVNFLKALHSANQRFFGFGAEEISMNDRLFSNIGLTETIARIGFGDERAKGGYVWLNFIGDSFRELVARGGQRYWENLPEHPISKMKAVVEDYLVKCLEQQNEIRISELWTHLKRAPIGLFKCVGAVFLLSLLLKDYVDKDLYLKDSTGIIKRLTGELLSSLIVNAVKETSDDKILVKQTAHQVKFSWMINELFGKSQHAICSPEEAVTHIKNRLAHIRRPFCLLNYFVDENYRDAANREEYLRLLKLLGNIIRSDAVHNRFAEDFFWSLDKKPELVTQLKELLHEKNFASAEQIFVARLKAQEEIFTRLNLSDTDCLTLFAEKFSVADSYSWTAAQVQSCVDTLKEELAFVESINGLLVAPQKKLSDAALSLTEKLNKIRLPRSLVEEFIPNLSSLFKVFSALQQGAVHNLPVSTEQINRSRTDFLNFFEHQFDYFKKAVTMYVEAFPTPQAVENLFSSATAGHFFQTRDDFIVAMKKMLERFRLNEKNAEFLMTWEKLTGTTSPRDWSKKNEIPILCMYQDCLEQAQQYFSALNEKKSLSATQLEGSLPFLRELVRLNNRNECARAFVKYFCGETYSVLIDADSLRQLLRRTLGNEVYTWFANKKNSEKQIKALSERKYREQALPIVRDLIRQMPAHDAQKYLLEMIEHDTLMGLRVLQSSKKEVTR